MSGNWLDLSSSSNNYIQSNMNGFLDVSGGNILLRNNSNLFVSSGDISLNGRLYTNNYLTANGEIFINKNDISLEGRLFVFGNISVGGNLSINSDYTYKVFMFVDKLNRLTSGHHFNILWGLLKPRERVKFINDYI
jgi:hypothetical protein